MIWTETEKQRLILLYPKYSNRWLARKFERTSSSITSRADKLGLHKDYEKGYRRPLHDERKWTEREIKFLKKHYKTMTFTQIGDVLMRTNASVSHQVKRQGLKKVRPWTAEEDNKLRQIYNKQPLEKLTKVFNRLQYAIYKRARKLEIPKRARQFSKKETKYLLKNYQKIPAERIAEELGRSISVVKQRAKSLGLKNVFINPNLWTEKEVRYLKRWFKIKKVSEVAEFLKKNPGPVRRKAHSLGLYRGPFKYWTKEQDEKLKKLYPKYINRQISEKLGKKIYCIANRGKRFGLRKDVKQGYKQPRPRKWTDEQIDFIKSNYQDMSSRQIASALEKSITSVKSQVSWLGLGKNIVWTPEKKNMLKKLYVKMSPDELAQKLGCAKSSLFKQAKKIGIPRKKPLWSKEEIAYLKQNFHKMIAAELAKRLNRPKESIYMKGKELGLGKKSILSYWTADKDKELKELYPKYANKEISKKLGKSVASLICHANELGLCKDAKQGYRKPGYRKTWTDKQISFLEKNYQNMSSYEIASAMGKTVDSVANKAAHLGLRKAKL